MSGGMLDRRALTPGIILAACHESQFNVKAFKSEVGLVDPWTYAITTVIKTRAQRNRGVPSYTILFNEAKTLIRRQLADGLLSKDYKGPSKDETNATPRNQEDWTSYQDPQLIFNPGYVDPDSERFLFPFTAATCGAFNDGALRYPKDEV
jgi:hypothetical protein